MLAPLSFCLAQDNSFDTNTIGNNGAEFLTALIDTNDTIEIGEKIIFDGSRSTNNIPHTVLTYSWDLGDRSKASDQEIVCTYDKHGEYTVTLRISNNTGEVSALLSHPM